MVTMMKAKAIPASIFAILKVRWKEADPNYSSFDANFNGDSNRERRIDPSYYHLRPGKKIDLPDFDVLTHAEAMELVREGAFGSLAKVREGGAVAINEHAQHALTDFCSEVYSAWGKYQRRLDEAERACPLVA